MAGDPLYLGFDLSTQQLKCVMADGAGREVGQAEVRYDSDLSRFGTRDGVVMGEEGRRAQSPTLMWVAALDLALSRLPREALGRVAAVSGAAQQHGSVFWAQGAAESLAALRADQPLEAQLRQAFSRPLSPVWMDSSTAAQCAQLEDAVGGPKSLCHITGSKAFHRFTGAQIAKVAQEEPEAYEKTARVALVSNFLTSLLCGQHCGPDFSDGSGMNLLDIRSRDWEQRLLNAAGSRLLSKLGAPVHSHSVAGPLSAYFVQRYGLPAACPVVTCTGDNPSSLAGLGLGPGDIGISLGTSDTVFLWTEKCEPQLDLHLLLNPIAPEKAFMAMLCFKNGSLTREKVRREVGAASWADAEKLVAETAAGNEGRMAVHFDLPEILPSGGLGVGRWDGADGPVAAGQWPAGAELRGVLEGQCLGKRVWAEVVGLETGRGRVVVTGGASANETLLQTLADVFGRPVEVLEAGNSAALGAALRARAVAEGLPWPAVAHTVASQARLAASPDPAKTKIYDAMAKRYKALESTLIQC